MNRRVSNDAIRAEYSRLARNYDQRWDVYVRRSIDETRRRMSIGAGGKLLDVGCGTGEFLAKLEKHHPELTLAGVDLSDEMLAVARTKLSQTLSLTQASVERLPFDNASFDIVVSISSFHYWRQPATGLAEIQRVLRPGGQLVITDWCDDYFLCKLCDLWLRLRNPSHFRAVGGRECQEAIARAGFETLRLDRYKISWLWGMMTVVAKRPVASTSATFPRTANDC